MCGFLTPLVDDTKIRLRVGEADAYLTASFSAALRENQYSTIMVTQENKMLIASVPINCVIHPVRHAGSFG